MKVPVRLPNGEVEIRDSADCVPWARQAGDYMPLDTLISQEQTLADTQQQRRFVVDLDGIYHLIEPDPSYGMATTERHREL